MDALSCSSGSFLHETEVKQKNYILDPHEKDNSPGPGGALDSTIDVTFICDIIARLVTGMVLFIQKPQARQETR